MSHQPSRFFVVNPLQWRREHQLALLVFALVGLALGFAFGYARDPHQVTFLDWLIHALNPQYPGFGGAWWGIFGALVGAASVYAAMLLRR